MDRVTMLRLGEDRSDGGGIMSLCSKSLIDEVLAHRND